MVVSPYRDFAFRDFAGTDVVIAVSVGVLVQVSFGVLLFFFITTGKVEAQEERVALEIPIAVQPVLDELPLLKLGGRRPEARLPDMWRKQAPVRRQEAASAPTPQARKTVDAIPSSNLVKPDAEAPLEDAEVVAEADELQEDDPDAEIPNIDDEGDPGGVEGGTETDPLRARHVSRYRMTVLNWFQQFWHPPGSVSGATCDQLRALRAPVVFSLDGNQTIVGFSVSGSGNGSFDAAVNSMAAGLVGRQIPPPPATLRDAPLGVVTPTFSGERSACTGSGVSTTRDPPSEEGDATDAAPEVPREPTEESPAEPTPTEPGERTPMDPSPAPAEPDPEPADPDPGPSEPDPAPAEPGPAPAEPGPAPAEPPSVPPPAPGPAEPAPVVPDLG